MLFFALFTAHIRAFSTKMLSYMGRKRTRFFWKTVKKDIHPPLFFTKKNAFLLVHGQKQKKI